MVEDRMFALCITLTLLCVAGLSATTAPVVDLSYARYQGIRNDTLGIVKYYGLPYAAPPTGELRWRAPVDIEHHIQPPPQESLAINASSPGPSCVQGNPAWTEELADVITSATGGAPISDPTTPENEDCLHLDIIVPQNPASRKLPVIVQIHGGGYVTGNSLNEDGSQFVSYANGSVVWVQIQYRLGVSGFLGSQDVLQDGVANAGLLDQRAALNWVQRNIHAFGGDPSQVTIWGPSAGGGSVTSQLILHGGSDKPPFHAAIVEYPWWQPVHTDDTLETQYELLLLTSNCSNLACLRNLSDDDLMSASKTVYETGYQKGYYGYGDYYFGPFVDGEIIRDLPSREFANQHFSQVPLLIDHDAQEGWMFTNFSLSHEREVQPDLEKIWPAANQSFFDQILQKHYPITQFKGTFWDDTFYTEVANFIPILTNNSIFYQRADIFADFAINCPTFYVAHAASTAELPVYKMRFAAGLEVHGATVEYLLYPAEATGNATLADAMKDYFLSFALAHDPNALSSQSLPTWPRYSDPEDGRHRVLEVDADSIHAVQDRDASARCKFFHEQSGIVRN
ncbi:carboxylesterase type B [Penicillium hispanicum]|uniref:carboxylesterase type B n=1 Tax=Penicillium hispanicum TaxID=1080232 RepID=UPI002540FFEB|nr:carboxylesterase type B [Penicillium hispanicum]KAJ5591890.1 carboxylesterase type B [Penicillium hispanicum]